MDITEVVPAVRDATGVELADPGGVEIWAVWNHDGRKQTLILPRLTLAEFAAQATAADLATCLVTPVRVVGSVAQARLVVADWPAGRYECWTPDGQCLAVLHVGADGVQAVERPPGTEEEVGDFYEAA